MWLNGIPAVLLVLCVCTSGSSKEEVTIPGHMKKLGSHRDPLGVTMTGKFSNPAVFYKQFVEPGKPLWMRSVLDAVDHPGLNWTDKFLRSQYGNVLVSVESNKKENRESESRSITLRKFLSLYKVEEIYMVHPTEDSMKDLVLIPPSLHCGGFQKSFHAASIWMGSGNTMSVLHRDELDNVMCVMDGRKDFLLIDKAYKEAVEADGFVTDGAYSLVDVEKVDMKKFPQLATVPWHEVHLDKGDCIYVPKDWYHQVNSSKSRHLAVNIFFSRLLWFDSANCSMDQNLYKPLEPVSTFGFSSPNEYQRELLLIKVKDKGILLKHVFIDSIDTSTEERRSQFFDAVDKYKDSVLSWSELYGFDIDTAIVKFPDIFGLDSNNQYDPNKEEILYDPLPAYDDMQEDDDDDINVSPNQGQQSENDDILSSNSQDTCSSDESSQSTCSDVRAPPLPNEPEADAVQNENDWIHHDLYRQNHMGEEEDVHEHAGHEYYSYTESDDNLKNIESGKKDEL